MKRGIMGKRWEQGQVPSLGFHRRGTERDGMEEADAGVEKGIFEGGFRVGDLGFSFKGKEGDRDKRRIELES